MEHNLLSLVSDMRKYSIKKTSKNFIKNKLNKTIILYSLGIGIFKSAFLFSHIMLAKNVSELLYGNYMFMRTNMLILTSIATWGFLMSTMRKNDNETTNDFFSILIISTVVALSAFAYNLLNTIPVFISLLFIPIFVLHNIFQYLIIFCLAKKRLKVILYATIFFSILIILMSYASSYGDYYFLTYLIFSYLLSTLLIFKLSSIKINFNLGLLKNNILANFHLVTTEIWYTVFQLIKNFMIVYYLSTEVFGEYIYILQFLSIILFIPDLFRPILIKFYIEKFDKRKNLPNFIRIINIIGTVSLIYFLKLFEPQIINNISPVIILFYTITSVERILYDLKYISSSFDIEVSKNRMVVGFLDITFMFFVFTYSFSNPIQLLFLSVSVSSLCGVIYLKILNRI